jgi:hypothetical protein
MNFLKKGPELKRPALKIPDFLYDLFYDLKERHLLPLVAVLIVAMIAIPILLKSKHSSPEGAEVAPITATASNAGGEQALVVTHSSPGLRDLRRRLSHDQAVDPFTSKVDSGSSGEDEAAAEGPTTPAEAPPVEATVIGGESTESSVPIKIPSESGISVPDRPSESSGGGPTRTKTRYANDSIDVRIVAIPDNSSRGGKDKPQAEVRRNLPELTMLPSRSTPAATFMGVSRDGKKALMVVSSDVVSIFGEATCVVGSKSCQLLALEPEMPVTFVYGPEEHRYRIEVLKIEKTLSAKPRRATLGATKPKTKSQSPHEGGGASGGGNSEIGDGPAER